MSTDEAIPRLPFIARLFQSSALKSWRAEDADPLRHALSAAIEGLRAGRPLVLDILVDVEAELLEPLFEASTVLHWRSKPSKEFGARVRRLLGFYSGESTLAAAVLIENAAQLESLLRGNILWDGELTMYPQPETPLADLPDPHFELTAFAGHVGWSVNQDAGSESWLVTAPDEASLDRVCTTLTQAFTNHGLPSNTAPGPKFSTESH